MTNVYDLSVRFQRRVAPRDYEHGEAEVKFSAEVEGEGYEQVATDLMASARKVSLTALGVFKGKAGTESKDPGVTAETVAVTKKTETKSETKTTAADDDGFGDGEAAAPVTKKRGRPSEADKKAAAAAAKKGSEDSDDGFGDDTEVTKPTKAKTEKKVEAEVEEDEFAEFEEKKPAKASTKGALTPIALQKWINDILAEDRGLLPVVRDTLFKIGGAKRTDDVPVEKLPLIKAAIEKARAAKK